MKRALAAILAISLAGCGRGPDVMRVVNGRLVGGAFVEPEAYASFLRGAIADARGDSAEALAAYTDAAQRDSDDPEIWTRIGDVRCRANPADPDPTWLHWSVPDPVAAPSRAAFDATVAELRHRITHVVAAS